MVQAQIKVIDQRSCWSFMWVTPSSSSRNSSSSVKEEKKTCDSLFSFPHTQLQSRPKLQFDQTEGSPTTSRAALSPQSWSLVWRSNPVDSLLLMFQSLWIASDVILVLHTYWFGISVFAVPANEHRWTEMLQSSWVSKNDSSLHCQIQIYPRKPIPTSASQSSFSIDI